MKKLTPKILDGLEIFGILVALSIFAFHEYCFMLSYGNLDFFLSIFLGIYVY
jgi:hypothetical protein